MIDRSHLQMRVWERGSGETWACGTGACASCGRGSAQWALPEERATITVHLRGGDLRIRYTDEARLYDRPRYHRIRREYRDMTKYIFVTGGVVSGLGKGITAASLGRLLKIPRSEGRGAKLDPYINVDPGHHEPVTSTARSLSPRTAPRPTWTSATTSALSTRI